MAAKAKTKAQETDMDLDFDSYTEQDWERDMRQAGEKLENKYIVKFPSLYIKTMSGKQYHLPLDLTPRQIEAQAQDLDKTPLDQITGMLKRANPGKERQIDDELSSSLLAIGDRYGEVIEEVHMASMGKYEPSVPSSTGTESPSVQTSPATVGASQGTSAAD